MLQLRLLKLLIVVLLSSASFAKNPATTKTTCQLLKKRTKKSFNDVIIASVVVDKGVNNSTTVRSGGVFTRWDPTLKENVLTFYGLMLAGAVARSVAATAVHPLNVIKTLLQKKDGKFPDLKWSVLSRGAGSQFIMSVPHGAINFVVTETMKTELAKLSKDPRFKINDAIPKHILNPLLDFLSSSISTFICSIVSTPQMVLTDRIMSGFYDNFFVAVRDLYKAEGIPGFFLGWLPSIVQKIPSYALTWMFFQQLKAGFITCFERLANSFENLMLGSVAAAGACCIMIPIDTIKTRIVTQNAVYNTGMWDCLNKVLKEEGLGSLYRALPPRLCAVVPMIGIQFAVYEFMKRLLTNTLEPLKGKISSQEASEEIPNNPEEVVDK